MWEDRYFRHPRRMRVDIFLLVLMCGLVIALAIVVWRLG